jgi:tetratricopeptide (TPR) repeat protein
LAFAKAGSYFRQGQYQEAVESVLEQAEIYRSNGEEGGQQLALSNAAIYECALGRFDSAITRLHTALETLQRIQSPVVHQTVVNLARAYALSGDREKALAYGREAVPYSQRIGWTARLLHCVALVHARYGDESRAVCLASYFEAAYARVGFIPTPMQATVHNEIRDLTQAALSLAQLDRYTAISSTMSEERAIGVAFDIESSVDELISRSPSHAIVA